MNSNKVTSKLIYFGSIVSMCAILVFVTYNYFLRSIKVDVMKDIVITYTGENGNASVSAYNGSDDLNKRTQSFLDTVVYEIEPNTYLSNGDMIHVVASFDETIANQFHFVAKNVEKDFEVVGLNYRYETLEDIDEEYLNNILEEATKYIDESKDDIYRSSIKDDGQFTDVELFYKAFMKSNSPDVSDRIIVVFKMVYDVEIQSETEEEIEPIIEQRAMYYTVTVPDVNDGKQVSSDIFGEKAYLKDEELENEDISGYIQRLYKSQFNIYEIIEPEEEMIEEEIIQEEKEDEKDI